MYTLNVIIWILYKDEKKLISKEKWKYEGIIIASVSFSLDLSCQTGSITLRLELTGNYSRVSHYITFYNK